MNRAEAKALLDAVWTWQADANLHPLTCGNDSQRHRALVPDFRKANGGEEYTEVYLRCLDCDYQQQLSEPRLQRLLLAHAERKWKE